MNIRLLEGQEIHTALEIASGIFNGLENEEEILLRAQEEELLFAGCFSERQVPELLGWGMMDSGGQIHFLFVKEEHRGNGMGKAITGLLVQVCAQKYSVLRITADVPRELAPFFQRCGLTVYAGERLENGRTIVPMELMISPAFVKPKKNKLLTGVIIGVICGIVIVLGIIIFLLARKVVHEMERQTTQIEEWAQEETPFWEDGNEALPDGLEDGDLYDSDGEWTQEPSESDSDPDDPSDDFDKIEAYVSPDVSYELTEETYSEYHDDETEYVDYEIRYPQVSALASGKEKEVNEILREAAMIQAQQYYLEPPADVESFLAEQEWPYLGSKVDYKVTYMDENLLCVIYSDHYFTGSVLGEYLDLRTRVVDLNTGTCYNLEDVLAPDGDFVESWREKILEQEPDNAPAEELSDEVFQQTLTGEIVDGRYFSNLILKKDGIEVGFTYHFRSDSGDRITRGWVTAPFTLEEIEEYQTDSEMWDRCWRMETNN